MSLMLSRMTVRRNPFLGLIDRVTQAQAAYSLRALTSNFLFKPVVRVRRDTDNDEQDFTAREITDGALASWVGSGNNGFVRTWYDQSGNERDAEQESHSNQPIIVENGVISPHGIYFNNSNQNYLALGSIWGFLPEDTEFTVMCRARRVDAQQNDTVFSIGEGSGTGETRGMRVHLRSTSAPPNRLITTLANTESQGNTFSVLRLEAETEAVAGFSREFAYLNSSISSNVISGVPYPLTQEFSTDRPSRIGASQGFGAPRNFCNMHIHSVVFYARQLNRGEALTFQELLENN